jgi:hypothetical protein
MTRYSVQEEWVSLKKHYNNEKDKVHKEKQKAKSEVWGTQLA